MAVKICDDLMTLEVDGTIIAQAERLAGRLVGRSRSCDKTSMHCWTRWTTWVPPGAGDKATPVRAHGRSPRSLRKRGCSGASMRVARLIADGAWLSFRCV